MPTAKPEPATKLGAPRIFIEVMRPIEGGSGALMCRKEIDLHLWLSAWSARDRGAVVAVEIDSALAEVTNANG